MLMQILIHNPPALVTIVERTPSWVAYLLLGLLALGLSQMFHRRASLPRILLTPAAMTGLSVYGMVSAFGATTPLAMTLTVWLVVAGACTALAWRWRGAPPPGTLYDAASRSFELPGSVVPMVLIIGIFLTKYVVGVEMAMQSTLASDSTFALGIAVIYGAFNGIFAARTLRLWRLTRTQPAASACRNAWCNMCSSASACGTARTDNGLAPCNRLHSLSASQP